MATFRITAFFALLAMAGLGATAESASETTAGIVKILSDRVNVSKKTVGIVVGVVTNKGIQVLPYGTFAKGATQKVDGNTEFEIGGLTKVMTAALLANLSYQGKVTLNDPVSKFLPAAVSVPHFQGKSITLLQLSTHTSGLPQFPENLHPRDPANPYADYSVADLLGAVGHTKLARAPGTKFEYSNFGYWLLGYVLTLKTGLTYDDLLARDVSTGLGMPGTRVNLTPVLATRLASGYDAALRPAPNWTSGPLAGSSALHSTVNDLVKFVQELLGYSNSGIGSALRDTLIAQAPAGGPSLQGGAGWTIQTVAGQNVVWQDGSTAGYRAIIALDVTTRSGVVILSNSANSVSDIAFHLLNNRYPISK